MNPTKTTNNYLTALLPQRTYPGTSVVDVHIIRRRHTPRGDRSKRAAKSLKRTISVLILLGNFFRNGLLIAAGDKIEEHPKV